MTETGLNTCMNFHAHVKDDVSDVCWVVADNPTVCESGESLPLGQDTHHDWLL